MIVFANISKRRRKRRYVVGAGFFDWLPSLSNAIGSAGNFLSNNKDTIMNVADVVGNVAKAGATTASAVKQIVDIVKAKRASSGVKKEPPVSVKRVLSEKSIEYLKHLASEVVSPPPQSDINSRIEGAGFKTVS